MDWDNFVEVQALIKRSSSPTLSKAEIAAYAAIRSTGSSETRRSWTPVREIIQSAVRLTRGAKSPAVIIFRST